MRPRIKLLEFAAASRDGVARDLSGIDTGALAEDLRRVVEGEVRFEPGDRALWAHDASNFRHVPLGTVLPKHAADVTAALEVCRRYQAPVFPRGAGTSLSGQTNNGGVCFDFSKYMTEIIEINASERWARVQPGVILDHLRDAAEEFGLTFGPDPSTHSRCVMGGVLGNDSCGVHSVMAGKAVDNVIELDVVLYDGTRMTLGKTPEDRYERTVAQGGREAEIYTRLKALGDRYGDEIRKRYPDIPRRVSGYNLDDLLPERDFNLARALVGSEGTCAFILEAKVRLVPSPPHRSLLVAGYETIYQAADHVVEIMKAGPIGLEALDGELIEFALRQGMNREEISLLPKDCGGYLMIEFGGQSIAEADAKAAECERMLNGKEDAPVTQLFDDPGQERKLWDVREAGLGATAFVPGRPDAWPGWEDAAVDPSGLGGYLREFQQLLDRYDYDTALYGHFGQGCVHCRLPFDLRTASGIQKYRAFLEEAADLCLKYNGSLSGEHGDGQQRGELLPKMFGEELMDAFREFKFIWDPDWKMNPGKLVDAKPLDANLKLGINYNPPNSKTYFTYRNEGRSFSRAALRCVGIGKCRRTEGGTMCPSYMVTREEKHSTRGRARLLFEMLQGQAITKGWRDKAVLEALDLCLSCKGCKNECPVNVDMATYKAEFYAHHYKRRIRPVQAYSLGLIYWWARLGSKAPKLANFTTHAPVVNRAVKRIAGVEPKREGPRFASETFTDWFRKRDGVATGGQKVILWPDTFNNYFHSGVAKATCEVLEHFGCEVSVPSRPLCCGRPLYDYGMLPTAKYLLRQIIETLRDDIRSGVPLVGAEPSCLAVFRDELLNLFPDDEDAKRLSQESYTLAEFFEKNGWDVPRLHRRVLVHGHCHHKSIMRMDADRRLLDSMGLDYTLLDSGCCGLAGSFGFEAGEKYEVSVKAGERALLPAVRGAERDVLVVTDGFSCRAQIEQFTDRRPIHLAQLLSMAIQEAEPDRRG